MRSPLSVVLAVRTKTAMVAVAADGGDDEEDDDEHERAGEPQRSRTEESAIRAERGVDHTAGGFGFSRRAGSDASEHSDGAGAGAPKCAQAAQDSSPQSSNIQSVCYK